MFRTIRFVIYQIISIEKKKQFPAKIGGKRKLSLRTLGKTMS